LSHAAGNCISDSGCFALARALPHLSDLQQFYLNGNYFYMLFFCFVGESELRQMLRDTCFHPLQRTTSATPVALRSQELCRTSRRFKICGLVVIMFDVFLVLSGLWFGVAPCASVHMFSHAAVNSIGASGCSALAGALPHLSALQQLHLRGNYKP
jgi:hypothetical protein